MRRTVATFCRICPSFCGLQITLDGEEVIDVVGDRDHPATEGFNCRKGRNIHHLHNRSDRFLTSQRGDRRGGFVPIETDRAINEVGARLRRLRAAHGPDSIGVFLGTQGYQATATIPVLRSWVRAVGTHKYFRTLTIDQSAKVVAYQRLGTWAAGNQRFDESDVWLFVGTNPVVSMQGGPTGFPIHRGRRAVREARDRGMFVIVVDPARTETALEADLHLRVRPGTDALLAAALHHVILEEGLYDASFCESHTNGLDELRTAVREFSPGAVADAVGVPTADIVTAARRFGSARRGMATTGTGPNMARWSNLSEHLIQALNVTCGRFPREGDLQAGYGMLMPHRSAPAQAISPRRPWEAGYQSRLGFGQIDGDLPTSSLVKEIVEPGEDRVRALVVVGGNPVAAIPDQDAVVDAFGKLELLVTLDPFPTETARMADYVMAPAMMLERSDSTRANDDWFAGAFAQYATPVLPAPPGVLEDWRILAGLADSMGLPLSIGSLTVTDGVTCVDTDTILDHLARHGQADPAEIRKHPHGLLDQRARRPMVGPPNGEGGEFELMPNDVAAELASAAREKAPAPGGKGYALLTVRRRVDVMNSLGRGVPGMPRTESNPCYLHPSQLAEIGGRPGDLLAVTSLHGRVEAVAAVDETLLPGTVSLAHCFGSPGQNRDVGGGVNAGLLLSLTDQVEDINAMPLMSGVPVNIEVVTDEVQRPARVVSPGGLV